MQSRIDTLAIFALVLLFAIQLPASIVGAYVLAAIYVCLRAGNIRVKWSTVLCFCVIASLALLSASTLNHGLTPFFYIAVSPLLYIMAYDFCKNSLQHICYVLRNVLWMALSGVTLAAALNWTDPEPLGAVFPWASTNGFPSYLIVILIAYSIVLYLKNKQLPFYSSLFTFSIAIIGVGRASIIIAGAILLLSILINAIAIQSFLKRALTGIALSLLAVFAFVYADTNWTTIAESLQSTETGSKLSGGLFDEHRARQIADYVDKIDLSSFFIGSSYDGTSIKNIYGGNPHNSYIRAHAFYGIFVLIAALLPLTYIIFLSSYGLTKAVLATLVGLALVRATTEPIFFPSVLDFFYICYFSICHLHAWRASK